MTKPLESAVETEVGKRLEQFCANEERAILYLKLNILGIRGFPDRLILFAGKGILFVEFKRKGEKPRMLQEHWHRILRRMGFEVRVYDDADKAFNGIVEYIS